MISSSIRLSFTGEQVGCTTKRSRRARSRGSRRRSRRRRSGRPRRLPSGVSTHLQISFASARFALPLNMVRALSTASRSWPFLRAFFAGFRGLCGLARAPTPGRARILPSSPAPVNDAPTRPSGKPPPPGSTPTGLASDWAIYEPREDRYRRYIRTAPTPPRTRPTSWGPRPDAARSPSSCSRPPSPARKHRTSTLRRGRPRRCRSRRPPPGRRA